MAGCGDLDPGEAERAQKVTEEVVAKWPAGSPERAFLTWYRAALAGSGEVAAPLYDPALGVTAQQIAVWRFAGSSLLNPLGRPRILETVSNGREARIYTLLPRESHAPNGRTDVYRVPQAFTLTKVRGEWLLANATFLRAAAAGSRKAAAQREAFRKAAEATEEEGE